MPLQSEDFLIVFELDRSGPVDDASEPWLLLEVGNPFPSYLHVRRKARGAKVERGKGKEKVSLSDDEAEEEGGDWPGSVEEARRPAGCLTKGALSGDFQSNRWGVPLWLQAELWPQELSESHLSSLPSFWVSDLATERPRSVQPQLETPRIRNSKNYNENISQWRLLQYLVTNQYRFLCPPDPARTWGGHPPGYSFKPYHQAQRFEEPGLQRQGAGLFVRDCGRTALQAELREAIKHLISSDKDSLAEAENRDEVVERVANQRTGPLVRGFTFPDFVVSTPREDNAAGPLTGPRELAIELKTPRRPYSFERYLDKEYSSADARRQRPYWDHIVNELIKRHRMLNGIFDQILLFDITEVGVDDHVTTVEACLWKLRNKRFENTTRGVDKPVLTAVQFFFRDFRDPTSPGQRGKLSPWYWPLEWKPWPAWVDLTNLGAEPAWQKHQIGLPLDRQFPDPLEGRSAHDLTRYVEPDPSLFSDSSKTPSWLTRQSGSCSQDSLRRDIRQAVNPATQPSRPASGPGGAAPPGPGGAAPPQAARSWWATGGFPAPSPFMPPQDQSVSKRQRVAPPSGGMVWVAEGNDYYHKSNDCYFLSRCRGSPSCVPRTGININKTRCIQCWRT
ncbi:hypothetical protein WMF18_16480 [Sorangium sp. So ce315]|uniref:hypothetical protein n=1 Tax=Sorangium sp. So ce315 TaxID=3133299 RepID=UPI003F628A78